MPGLSWAERFLSATARHDRTRLAAWRQQSGGLPACHAVRPGLPPAQRGRTNPASMHHPALCTRCCRSRPTDQLRLAVAEALCRTAARRNEFASAVYAVEAEDKMQK